MYLCVKGLSPRLEPPFKYSTCMIKSFKVVMKLKKLFKIFREFWTKPLQKGKYLNDFGLPCTLFINCFALHCVFKNKFT